MHRTLLLVAAMASLAACGGSDAVEPSVPGGASSTSVAAVDSTVAPSTVPDSAEPGSDTTTPVSTAGGATAECMQGRWTADAAEHQRRLDSISIALPMTVGADSLSELTISGDAFVADASLSVSASIGPATLTSSGTSHIEGTFTLDGDLVQADVTVNETEQGPFVAMAEDGTVVSFPGADAFDPPAIAPSFAGSTVQCDDTSLSFDVIGTDFGSVTYTRAG